ncbi:unnamed protein product [Gordionus sp. m RMFG-2023]
MFMEPSYSLQIYHKYSYEYKNGNSNCDDRTHKNLQNYKFKCNSNQKNKEEFNYPSISEETLLALAEYFESFEEHCDSNYDVTYSDGVLTINLPQKQGIYVINKQAPNRQIWLSSPISGPKRYDLVNGIKWVYASDGVSMHELLNKEIPTFISSKKKDIDFTILPFGGKS